MTEPLSMHNVCHRQASIRSVALVPKRPFELPIRSRERHPVPTGGTLTMMDTIHDSLILGAGPAGLQLAYFLAKRQRDYVVLEATDRAGAFFQR